jgi:hypothetical protein
MSCISLPFPGIGLDARIKERVSAPVEFAVQGVQIAYYDEHRRPWHSIIVMRGQVEPHTAAGDLQVHRPVALAVLRVQRASG